jgi:hypothetical protein
VNISGVFVFACFYTQRVADAKAEELRTALQSKRRAGQKSLGSLSVDED